MNITEEEASRLRAENPEIQDILNQVKVAPDAKITMELSPEVAVWLAFAGSKQGLLGRQYAAKLLTDIFYGRR